MTTFSGRSTAMRRSRGFVEMLADREFQHRHVDDAVGLGDPDALDEVADRRGGTPRRRNPASVGMRGSSQPVTWPPRTSSVSTRFDSTV